MIPRDGLIWSLAVTFWARFHQWPESLTLALRGAPVPAELVRAAEAARLLEQVRQREEVA